ncbi:hypothetical protein GX586_15565 [bacterium]|nr:hypothetical protein [bacterium]
MWIIALKVLAATTAGTFVSALLACLPALHVYNVASFILVFHGLVQHTWFGEPVILMPFMMGLIVGYATVNTVPSVFLGAPDESAMLMVFPTQKYLMQGRGYEATVLTGIGSLGGVVCLLLVALVLPKGLPVLRTVLSPHYYWILVLVLSYMILSEFPKGGDRGATRTARFLDAWKSLAAGIATALLSGWLGFILLRKPLISVESAFMNIMPAFVGLFGVPWVIQNIISGTDVPKQHTPASVDCTSFAVFRGVSAGFLGGFFAAYTPIITGGIGGLLAGHATAQNDERSFIISQGASKFVYYVGAFLLFFVPAAVLSRGGLANMMRVFYVPRGYHDYAMILAALAFSGAMSFVMLLGLARVAIWFVQRVNYRYASYATLLFMVSLVTGLTGLPGLFIMIVSTGIGMIPVLYHSRRSHCMCVLLIPVALDMAGYGQAVATWMGLG